MKQRLKKEWREFVCLVKSVPTLTTVFFVMSVFAMNLLANKSVALGVDWLAIDCGIILSWFAFLTMDVLTKHFGPKAATELSVLAMFIELLFCLFMFIGSIIPGMWGESFVDGGDIINTALDKTFGGAWYVILGSMLAFITSSVVNNFINYGLGKAFKNPDGPAAFVLRSYVSTAVGQFVDNLVFAFAVSHLFFGWSALQCVTCALTGMVAELLFEVVFSFFGYRTCKRWRNSGVGAEYFALVGASNEKSAGKEEVSE